MRGSAKGCSPETPPPPPRAGGATGGGVPWKHRGIIIMKEFDPLIAGPMLSKVAEANFPSRFGHFRIYGFEGSYGQDVEECVVLRLGDVVSGDPPLVRIHSQCLTGDVFHSLRCD